MDSAVWMMQTVIDQHRREREADAAAHRRVRDGVPRDEASERSLKPFRRRRRSHPVPVVVVAAAPEPAGDELELVGAGDPH
jgi:hypothetical protein